MLRSALGAAQLQGKKPGIKYEVFGRSHCFFLQARCEEVVLQTWTELILAIWIWHVSSNPYICIICKCIFCKNTRSLYILQTFILESQLYNVTSYNVSTKARISRDLSWADSLFQSFDLEGSLDISFQSQKESLCVHFVLFNSICLHTNPPSSAALIQTLGISSSIHSVVIWKADALTLSRLESPTSKLLSKFCIYL